MVTSVTMVTVVASTVPSASVSFSTTSIGTEPPSATVSESSLATGGSFTGVTVIFAFLAVLFAGGGWVGLIGPLALGGFMAWQIRELDIDDPAQCLRLFRATRFGGFFMLGFMLLDSLF